VKGKAVRRSVLRIERVCAPISLVIMVAKTIKAALLVRELEG